MIPMKFLRPSDIAVMINAGGAFSDKDQLGRQYLRRQHT
jgi:hypothetical protein